MSVNQGPLGAQVFEGAFASRATYQNGQNRFPSAPAGAGAFVAQPGGTIQGRFGWGDPATGLVANTRVTSADQIGIVLPLQISNGSLVQGYGWSWQFWDPLVCAWRIRQGINLTLMAEGEFWLRFAGGAYTGESVYASLVDGSAISGQTDDAELTRFKVCSNAGPGCLAMVSPYAFFGD